MRKTEQPRERESARILVVDHNPHVLAALVDLFEDERGLHVVGAALDAADAMALALLRRPDAVVIDVHMPDGGGHRVVATIRDILPDVRIFTLSAFLDQDNIFTLLATGADMCFSKTADFTTLIRSLTP